GIRSWIRRCRCPYRSRPHLRKLRESRQPSAHDAIERHPVADDVLAHDPAAVVLRLVVGLNGLLWRQPIRPAAISAASAKHTVPRRGRPDVYSQPGDRIIGRTETARSIPDGVAELKIFKPDAVRVCALIEVDANGVRRSVVGITKSLCRTGGAIRTQIAVLKEVEAIERPCVALHVPVQAPI